MASATSEKKYQLVVFGASGFTGQFVVEEIAKTFEEENKELSWAIAGRNMKKLQSVLEEAGRRTGKNLEEIPIVIADVSSESSLDEMCRDAEVVLNCVGPYRQYGHPVVRACIENKTHHIDISGEPTFLENCQLLYNQQAKENGVYILGSCGFDSIPCDMGVVFAQKQFPGDINDIECFLKILIGPEGGAANTGTWESAIEGFAHVHELKEIRKRLFPVRLPKPDYRIAKRSLVFKSSDVEGYNLPFVGSDRSVVTRTQYYNYNEKKSRPVQMNVYLQVTSILALLYFFVVGIIFGILCKFSLGRTIMKKFPKATSLGMFTPSGPTRKQMAGCSFVMTMVSRGFETKLSNPVEKHEKEPTKKMITTVTGPEPGYITTPICMVQAAYTLLKKDHKIPPGGGVLTPGAAFAETDLIERLQAKNIKFTKVE
ncbi:hypothetical protein CAPTEDRAFT_155386 [Capitella teleta]|uniref:Saccharopine dehydrogenase NADP binding domain-containing protein n=1 Tax=Capitella teleta TaxID=283909 RepID=R7V948_CAPTE|nr:hypothetical protein CAPTEDRAFT_155386 [Capitella teleta]|eukprot:ELU12886.1 hypothetical protein CAPTEDRAFT_155386 [Capitella teleta]